MKKQEKILTSSDSHPPKNIKKTQNTQKRLKTITLFSKIDKKVQKLQPFSRLNDAFADCKMDDKFAQIFMKYSPNFLKYSLIFLKHMVQFPETVWSIFGEMHGPFYTFYNDLLH